MTKITFEEHKIFGELTKIFNDKLAHEQVRIFNLQKNKTFGRLASKRWKNAVKHLSMLRDNLEEIMFRDYPNRATTGIYYGKRGNISK